MGEIVPIDPIDISTTKKILEQMSSCICKIKASNEESGTGFFCKVNSMNFLMTCYHIMDEKYLKENKELNLSLNNEKELIKIDLGIKRVIYCKIEYNSTFIELKEEDKIKNYLELDDNLFKDDEYIANNFQKFHPVYVLQYLHEEGINVSYGCIDDINGQDIPHICKTKNGSAGSPILNLTNNKVIGIHKEEAKDDSNFYGGYGTLLKYPLIDFRRKGYKIIKELGTDGFGKVNQVFSKLDNKYFAMKEILLQGATEDIEKMIH